jgi:hypothetical protein
MLTSASVTESALLFVATERKKEGNKQSKERWMKPGKKDGRRKRSKEARKD